MWRMQTAFAADLSLHWAHMSEGSFSQVTAQLFYKFSNLFLSGNITLGGDNIIDPSKLRNQILSQNLSLTSDVIDWLLNATLNRRVTTSFIFTFTILWTN